MVVSDTGWSLILDHARSNLPLEMFVNQTAPSKERIQHYLACIIAEVLGRGQAIRRDRLNKVKFTDDEWFRWNRVPTSIDTELLLRKRSQTPLGMNSIQSKIIP
jgi:hypothetical protein